MSNYLKTLCITHYTKDQRNYTQKPPYEANMSPADSTFYCSWNYSIKSSQISIFPSLRILQKFRIRNLKVWIKMIEKFWRSCKLILHLWVKLCICGILFMHLDTVEIPYTPNKLFSSSIKNSTKLLKMFLRNENDMSVNFTKGITKYPKALCYPVMHSGIL